MKLYKSFLTISLFIFTLHQLSAQRAKYNFNPGWKVFVGDPAGAEAPSFNDADWKNVTLPYAWNEDDAFKKDIAELSTGIAWYRKHFTIPADAKGKKVFLEFEGIRQAGDIYLNGVHIGLHENGITAFGFDISDKVLFDKENVIAVRTDNSWTYKERSTGSAFEWNDRNFYANYGGINKNVYLHITGKLYQSLPLFTNLGTIGVYVYADHIDIPGHLATIHVSSEVKNEDEQPKTFTYKVIISDIKGKPIKTFNSEPMTMQPGETKVVQVADKVSDLHWWSWGYGYLYNVKTILEINGKDEDIVNTKTGFRKTAFEHGMFYLNDRVIQVHGYAQRTTNEWPAIGSSVPAWMSDYSNRLMVQGNGNLVRWMHVTPWKQDVESCDRVGLMESMPAGDAEKDVEGRRWEQRKEVMRDAMIYNRNNPSIVFYECGNKGISEQHMQEMKAIRDMYDPFGGRAIGSREMLDSKTAEYGGEMLYINKSATKPVWAMEFSRDEGLRKNWDDYTPPYHKDGEGKPYKNESPQAYNHNMDSHAKEDIARWYDYWSARPGTGDRVSSGGVNIIFSESNTHHRGSENYRTSGEVDAMRIPKESYYANQLMWNGWVDINKPDIYIIGHWNYKEGVTKDVYVVSTTDKVQLFLNGKSLGFGEQQYRFLFTFKNVHWQPGLLIAEGYNSSGKKEVWTAKPTEGAAARIHLSLVGPPSELKADGHDLALLQVEVVDSNGHRCPTALNMVHFTLDGLAEWRGGIAQGPGNYILSKDLPVEGGVNRVLVRSSIKPGNITVIASADGLKSDTLHFASKQVAIVNGLESLLPAEGLPSYLERSILPYDATFQITRKSLRIVHASAGANSDSAYRSYDDNETTEWNNGHDLASAWIEYELDKEATISEVSMKLNNFRTKSYPIRITVDGKEVFKGNTDKNLGYYTAICKPQKGKKVRIELTAGSKSGNNEATEMSGQKLDDGVARNDANAIGTLSIIEIEFYEKAN